MQVPIPTDWKKLWEIWDLRSFVLFSLVLQIFLIFSAPLRKRTSSNWIIMPLWSAYLLADWAAVFALGLISNSQVNSSSGSDDNNADLLAFWAPFLLVHLGGPDTITAFALEDNELWLRHLLGFIVQSLAAVYVFFQSLPQNRLWIPTMLLILAGVIKYSERTRSLYLASMDSFRDSMITKPEPGLNYSKLMHVYYSKKEAGLPTEIEIIPEPDRRTKYNFKFQGRLTDLRVLHYGCRFFETFKGIIVDLIFGVQERNQSRQFFLNRESEDAFRVIEVELNLMYEALYTKVSVVRGTLGYICRSICIASVVVALAHFYFEKKHTFNHFDVVITYALLLGAIALDAIALLLFLLSDRTVVALHKLPEDKPPEDKVATGRDSPEDKPPEDKVATGRDSIKCLPSCFNWLMRFMSRRWSESFSTYNLIYYCLHPRREVKEKLLGYLSLFLGGFKHVRREPFTSKLRDHIFKELSEKSDLADDLETAKGICSARGEWVLQNENHFHLLPWIVDVEYDESLLLWHVATELCYSTDEDKDDNRDCSKLLSDYMLYLLVMQPTMMSAVAGIGQMRFQDTCADVKKFIQRRNRGKKQREANACQVIVYAIFSFFKYMLFFFLCVIFSPAIPVVLGVKKCFPQINKQLEQILTQAKKYFRRKSNVDEPQKQVCERLLNVPTDVRPVKIKGDRSKSVLFDACILAKKLRKLEEGEKWKILSKVWVELLCYAAYNCKANAHAAKLSRGGELITLVWLLMTHFGLGNRFHRNQITTEANIVSRK